MKSKSWKALPFLSVFAVAMIVNSVVAVFFNTTLFVIEASVALVAVFASLLIYFLFKKYVSAVTKSVIGHTDTADRQYLERFGFPVAVAGRDSEVLWYNSLFRQGVCSGREAFGYLAEEFLSGNKLPHTVAAKFDNVVYGGNKYTVYTNPVSNGIVMFFFDDTYYKDTLAEYIASRQSVALISFDNKESFSEMDEDDSTEVTARVESVIRKWAEDNNGLFRKLKDNQYIAIFEQRDLDRLAEGKFDVLTRVRSISLDGTQATISIGIGKGDDSLRKSLASAKKALFTALGRGGDQVAVLCGDDYEFFGGKSASSQTKSRVRTRIIAKSIFSAIADSDKVIITGHRYSDLDCIGCGVGLYGLVTRTFGKKAYVAVDYETSMAKQMIDRYSVIMSEGVFVSPDEALSLITPKTLLIIVDTQAVSMLEKPELYHHSRSVVIIDHHRLRVDRIDNALVFCHDPASSSATQICAEIISSSDNDDITKPEAEAMMAGIILDTKNFIVNSGTSTFETAAYLRRRGADTVALRQLFSDTIDIYRDKYKLISTARIYKKCAIVIAEDKYENIRLLASKSADELLGLSGVNASFVIYRTSDNSVNISARSYGERNVQLIMENLGGGGHHAVAAAQLGNVSFESAVRRLIEAIDGN